MNFQQIMHDISTIKCHTSILIQITIYDAFLYSNLDLLYANPDLEYLIDIRDKLLLELHKINIQNRIKLKKMKLFQPVLRPFNKLIPTRITNSYRNKHV